MLARAHPHKQHCRYADPLKASADLFAHLTGTAYAQSRGTAGQCAACAFAHGCANGIKAAHDVRQAHRGWPAPTLIDSTSCGPSVPSAEVDIRKSCHSRRHHPATIRGAQIDRPGPGPTLASRRHHPAAIRAAYAPVRVSQMHRADVRQTVCPLAFQTSAASCTSDVAAAHPTPRQADP